LTVRRKFLQQLDAAAFILHGRGGTQEDDLLIKQRLQAGKQRLLRRVVCSKPAKFGDLGGQGARCGFKLLQPFRLAGKNVRETSLLGRV